MSSQYNFPISSNVSQSLKACQATIFFPHESGAQPTPPPPADHQFITPAPLVIFLRYGPMVLMVFTAGYYLFFDFRIHGATGYESLPCLECDWLCLYV